MAKSGVKCRSEIVLERDIGTRPDCVKESIIELDADFPMELYFKRIEFS